MPKPFVASWPSNVNALIAVVGLFGLGCSDEGHRLGGAAYRIIDGVKIGACRDGADIEPIDFMEDGDATIELTEGRAGAWFSFHDKTEGGTQWPASDAEVFEVTELRSPRSESYFVARTHGKDFSDWGAGIGFELQSQKAYDSSRYSGVTFWARRGESGLPHFRFTVTDPLNAPRGKHCDPDTENPPCDNYFGVDLDLETEFRSYRYTWDELRQQGWVGFDPNARLAPSAVYGMRFQTVLEKDDEGTPRTTVFDFTIDDVALTCAPR